LKDYEDELLQLFNENCPSEHEKKQLINDLQEINTGTTEVEKPASRILSFIKATGVSLVSKVVVDLLEKLMTK